MDTVFYPQIIFLSLNKSGTSGFGQGWGNLNVVGREACNMQQS